jgi:putative peptidoglycan lipid II flippase
MGILTYGVAGQALGAFRLAEIKAMFKRSRA